ncbi:MAG: TauD/TfdA family dioxygenase, partial [Novosphingobium sp.]|nr:TauD/TfdA family dioxygenase [Novosphingobium sp.]
MTMRMTNLSAAYRIRCMSRFGEWIMAFTTKDLKPRIGTQVFADVETLVDGSVAKELKALLVERGVLLFRDLDMTDEQQLEFA